MLTVTWIEPYNSHMEQSLELNYSQILFEYALILNAHTLL
jgi:hypothetical protein